MGYNKETDYQAKINEAVKNGDYESAAKYEQSRNEKIDKENLSYEKTNKYKGWLDTTDYSNELRSQMLSKAPKTEVADTLKKRVEKASGTVGLDHYAYDDVYDKAMKYIMGYNESLLYREKPQYKNTYQNDTENLYRILSDMKNFSYNPFEDELYKYYKDQYTREGERAMEDLLGEISAFTGGIPSSYAISAAAQARENYSKRLNDIIPELYDDAYERYLDDIENKEKQLDILTALSDSEYKKYLDSLSQYNKDREYEYDRYNKDREYEAERLAYDEELAYKRQQDRIENALNKWKNMGYLDKESAEILNLPEGLHTTDYDYKKAQQYKLYSK